MKIKILILGIFSLMFNVNQAQDWKMYPYEPTGQVAFPLDEGRHATESIEWWYAAGHLTAQTSGKSYSFMYTFFHYPQTGFDGFRILNITDDDTGTFIQDIKPVNYTTLSTTSLDIEADVFLAGTEYWRNVKDINNSSIPFEYELFASTANAGLDISFETLKRPLIVGDDGFLNQGYNSYTYYYSLTSNAVTGSLTINGVTESVVGTGWIDRQYGNFNPFNGEQYEWFSIQLSNGMDLNLWNIFTAERQIPATEKYKILSVYTDENTQYTTDNFEIDRLSFNCMPDGERCYSSQWRLTSAINNIDLTITTLHDNTEVLLPFRFFEGATTISGTVNGTAVSGIGFSELLHGYEDPEITITAPTSGVYDTSVPITWTLNNPDDGRPISYDLEYSIDNQNNFNSIVTGLTEPSYLWENPNISTNDEVWFKIKAYSIDNTLTNTIISMSSSIATLSKEDAFKKNIKLYPNPVYNQFTLDFSKEETGSYQILDMSGRRISNTKTFSGSSLKVPTIELSNGVYFISLNTNENKATFKFVKKG